MTTESALRAIIFSSIAFSLIGSLKILFNIIVSHSFESNSILILGMANVALSFALLITTIISTGFANSMNRFISYYISRDDKAIARSIYERILKYNFLITFPTVLLISFFSENLAEFLRIDVAYIQYAAPIIFFSSFYYLIRATYYSLNDTREYLIREFLADMMFLIVLFASILLLPPSAILLSFSVMYLVFLIISIGRINKKLPKNKSSRSSVTEKKRHILTYASLTTIGTVMSMSTVYVANMYTGIIAGSLSAALFAAAYSVTTIVLLIPNVMSMILLPRISSLWGSLDNEGIKRIISLWTASLIIVCGIIIGIMIILSEDILSILFGTEFKTASMTLILLLIGVFFTTISRPSNAALVGTRYVNVPVIISIVAFCLAFAIWHFMIPTERELGAAFGFLVAACINSLGNILFARKLWSIRQKSIVLPIVTLLIFLSILLINFSLENTQNRIILSGLYILLFLGVNWRKTRQLWKEIREADSALK